MRVGIQRTLILICVAVLTAFPIPITETAGFQAGNDAAAQNARGLELFRSGKFEDAVKAYKEAIKIRKDFFEAHYNLGDAYFQMGEYKKAVDAYKQSIKYKPDFASAHNNLGTAYFKLDDHKKAIAAFNESIRLNPKAGNTYYNLASTYVEQENQQAALEQYKILKTLDPALAENLYILIYKPMAAVLDSTGARLRVMVVDSSGLPVNDLGQDDFQVFEDGVAQPISSFTRGRVPLVYALTVDTSGSLRPAFDLVIDTSKYIIQNNLPDDETLLIRFISSDKIETIQEFTTDKEVLKAGLDILFIEGGQSAILDAVYLAVERVAQYKFTNGSLRRAVILVSDGDERTSYYSLEDLIKLLHKADVQVFAISIGKGDQRGAKLNENQPLRSVELLTKLAAETGGQVFFPKSAAQLPTITQQMMNAIRTEYVIGYMPVTSVAGTFRPVSVRIVAKPGRENWSVVTRTGYVVPEKVPDREYRR